MVLTGADASSVDALVTVLYRHSWLRLVAYSTNCPSSRRPVSERVLTLLASRPAVSGSADHDCVPASNANACTETLRSAASLAIHTLDGVSNTKPYAAYRVVFW